MHSPAIVIPHIVGLVAILAWAGAAAANNLDRVDSAAIQTREDEKVEPRAASADELLGRSSEVYIGLGFDSNRDGQSPSEPSRFGKFETFHELRRDTDISEAALSLSYSAYRYNEDEIAGSRFDLEARFDGLYEFSDEEDVRFYTSYLRDWLSFSRADVFETQIHTRHSSDRQRFWLKLNSYTQLDRGDAEDDLAPGDNGNGFPGLGIDLGRTKTPDYTKFSLQAGYIPRPRAPVTVFVIGGLAHADYFNQDEDLDFDRTADDAYAIGGVRFNVGEDFRIDAGWRFNARKFDDEFITSNKTNGLDIRVDWTPFEGVTLSGKVERFYEETTSAFAIVDDVERQSLTLGLEPTEQLSIQIEGSHEIERPVGDIVRIETYELEGRATYTLTDTMELYGEALAKFVTEDTFDEGYERFRIESGVRLSY